MKISKTLYGLLLTFFAAVFLVSVFFVARYALAAFRQKQDYDQLAQLVDSARQEVTAPAQPVIADSQMPAPTVPAAPRILDAYALLYERNPDTVGWLSIDGTRINYPVMQSPDRANFYLEHNFDGQPSAHGCLYVRESCDVFSPSDNITIYGHHMKDGSMFSDLDGYRDFDFWKSHGSICFDTLYEQHTYSVFAVFSLSASAPDAFAYHRFEEAADESEFDSFVASCQALSFYDTGITPEFGDKLLCLSTCEYTHADGRLVVAAVRDDADISN